MNIEEIDFLRSCTRDEECFQKLQQYIKNVKRFRHLSDMSIDGVIISQDTVIVDANSAVSEIYGYTFDEIRGKTLFDFTTPESAQIALHNMQNGFVGLYELTAVHKDGHRFPIEIVGKNLEYDGEPYRLTIVRDITEQNKIQAEPEESRAAKIAILEITSDSIWTLDSDRCLVTFNSAYSNRLNNAFGIQLTKGMTLSEILPEEILETSIPFYNRAFAGERVTYEFQYKDNTDKDKDKDEYVEIVLNPIRIKDIVTGVIGVGRNITERKNNELSLKTSWANIAAFIENTEDSYWSVDHEYRLIILNNVYSDVLFNENGIRLHPGDAPHEFLPQEAGQYWIGLYDRCFAGESIDFDFEYAISSELRYYHISLHPIITDGVITGAACVSRDITERKKSEEALKNSQSNMTAVFENTDAAIWSIDPEFRLLTFNSAYGEVFFKTFGQRLGIGSSLIDLVPEATASMWKPMYARAFKGERFSFEFTIEQDGEQRFREVSLNPIYSGETIIGVTAFGRDITERKRNEEALKKSQAAISGLIENTQDSVWSVDIEYRLITFNSVFKNHFFKAYGIYPKEGAAIKDILPQEVFDYWSLLYSRACIGEQFTAENETEYEGRRYYTEVSLNPIISNGKITGIATYSRDVTERKESELALKTSQANIKAVIENTNDLIWSFDSEFKLITFNSNFSHYIRYLYGTEVFTGFYFFDIGTAQENEYWKALYSRALSGEKYSFELEYDIDGRKTYSDISFNPIVTNGTVTGVAVFGKDITERKESELALKKSQANTTTLIENTDASFWSVDTDYQVLILNTMYSYLYEREYRVKLQAGDSAFKGLTQENSAYWKQLYDRCFAGENISFDAEYNFKGELQYYNVTLSPIITDTMVTGAVCSSRDITGRMRTEEKLREHSVLLDIANEAIIVKDLHSRITFWNKAAERMYGWSAKEAIGKLITDLLYNKETIRSFEEARSELLFSGQWSGELTEQNRNGKKITTYCRCTLVFDTNGKPKSVLTINTDITEQKGLQQQFYRSQRMESLGTLAGGIAHDLNNVLTPILLSVEILRLKFPEEKNSRLLETIEVSAQRGSDIVQQVLMFARGIEGDRKPLSLTDSIREIGMIIRKTFSKSIEVLVSISDSVQPILGDATQIQQVLMNLCVNARDAMPLGGEICIELDSKIPTYEIFSTTPEAKSIEYTVLAITDSGQGIPPEILDKIFDPFFTTKEIGSGTGLGLSTVNAIVKSHNGFMKVFNNKKHKGTTFEIWLPASRERTQNDITPEPAALIAGQGKTILIVDDEPMILQLISYSLENFGFSILTANNGSEALLVFKENPHIELVITDVNMPEVDGPTLVAELIIIKPTLKFIIMTGLPINTRMDEMKSIGVSSFLSKPFKTQILLKAIENAFNPEVVNTLY